MKDRDVEYPNRYKLTAVAGEADTYDLEAVPGTVTEAGTDLNKSALLKDATATLFGLPSTAMPNDVLDRLSVARWYAQGAYTTSTTGVLATSTTDPSLAAYAQLTAEFDPNNYVSTSSFIAPTDAATVKVTLKGQTGVVALLYGSATLEIHLMDGATPTVISTYTGNGRDDASMLDVTLTAYVNVSSLHSIRGYCKACYGGQNAAANIKSMEFQIMK